ncbi:hypothetical protein CDAR_121811 [Caerostris darwini]|uniref:Uncharacterized protein n=1 Tax=Caerostris darwini TaxID=1538125 RepID=A0AAV4UFX8_9ARAC|nr:hypothetical protein CDAR_121811 [Caerostris darwini]
MARLNQDLIPEYQRSQKQHTTPEYQRSQKQHTTPEYQRSQKQHTTPEYQRSQQEHTTPEYQRSQQEHTTPEYQRSQQEHTTPEYQRSQQEHATPECQRSQQQHTAPECQRSRKQHTTPEPLNTSHQNATSDEFQTVFGTSFKSLRPSTIDGINQLFLSRCVLSELSLSHCDYDELVQECKPFKICGLPLASFLPLAEPFKIVEKSPSLIRTQEESCDEIREAPETSNVYDSSKNTSLSKEGDALTSYSDTITFDNTSEESQQEKQVLNTSNVISTPETSETLKDFGDDSLIEEPTRSSTQFQSNYKMNEGKSSSQQCPSRSESSPSNLLDSPSSQFKSPSNISSIDDNIHRKSPSTGPDSISKKLRKNSYSQETKTSPAVQPDSLSNISFFENIQRKCSSDPDSVYTKLQPTVSPNLLGATTSIVQREGLSNISPTLSKSKKSPSTGPSSMSKKLRMTPDSEDIKSSPATEYESLLNVSQTDIAIQQKSPSDPDSVSKPLQGDSSSATGAISRIKVPESFPSSCSIIPEKVLSADFGSKDNRTTTTLRDLFRQNMTPVLPKHRVYSKFYEDDSPPTCSELFPKKLVFSSSGSSPDVLTSPEEKNETQNTSNNSLSEQISSHDSPNSISKENFSPNQSQLDWSYFAVSPVRPSKENQNQLSKEIETLSILRSYLSRMSNIPPPPPPRSSRLLQRELFADSNVIAEEDLDSEELSFNASSEQLTTDDDRDSLNTPDADTLTIELTKAQQQLPTDKLSPNSNTSSEDSNSNKYVHMHPDDLSDLMCYYCCSKCFLYVLHAMEDFKLEFIVKKNF